MTSHKDVATAVQQWSVGETRSKILVAKNGIILNCVNACVVCTNITAISSLMRHKLTFTGVNLGPLRNVFAPTGVSSCLRACFSYFIFKFWIKQGVKSFVTIFFLTFILCDIKEVSV